MLVGEFAVLVLLLGVIQQCGGESSSALDSFLQGVLMVEQTLPQRSRRNVVKRPGVSLDHQDLQELQGVNADVEDEAQVYTGLDEASILRELQEVSGSSNLSKRQSGGRVMNVVYKKAQLHAGMRKNNGPRLMQIMADKQPSTKAALLSGLNQLPIYYSAEDRSHYKVGIKNNIEDKDYRQATFVKLKYLPQHKYIEEQEKTAINVNDMGNVKIFSNRRENLDGNEMNSGNNKIEDHINGAVPYKKINGVKSKLLLNEQHVSNTNHEDSIASSQHKITKTPEIQNDIHRIQPMNKHGLAVEGSWGTNVKKRPDEEEELQSIKDKDDPSSSDYLNYLDNYKDYNNIPDNYEDAEQSSQKFEMSESQSTKAHPWNGVRFHEIYSESSRVNPYKEILFEDPKLADNENLIDSIGSVTVPAKYSPSLIFRIDNSDEGRPKQMYDYLNNIPNTYRHSDVGKIGTKDNSHPEFIRKYSHMDSLSKDRVLNDENMIAHKKRLQKNNIVSNYPEKQGIKRMQIHDNPRKFAGKDPEILSIHEADLRYQGGYEHTLADLIHGELVTNIVRSIMNKVISDVNLRQHIASGFGAVTKGKSGRATKLAPTAEEMYCASRCAVERRADYKAADSDIPQSKCLALPDELKEFLKWMLEGSQEVIHSENQNLLLRDQLIFYSSRNRNGHASKAPEVGNKSYDPNLKKKMQLVLQLLAEYEQLNDHEKDTVSKVHHYLQEELERLQNESTEATMTTGRVEELDLTTSSLPFDLMQTFADLEQTQSRHSSIALSHEELIKQQLDMLGLGENAQLGQRLADRFDYSTSSSFQVSELPEPLPPLPPLLDNEDSVYK